MYGEVFNHSSAELRKMVKSLDQLQCWQKILGSPVSLGQAITSPFRPDTNPRCYLQLCNGAVLFKDFGSPIGHNYNVINAYSHLYNCSTAEAIVQMYFDRFVKSVVSIRVSSSVAAPKQNSSTLIVQPFMQGAVPIFTPNHIKSLS